MTKTQGQEKYLQLNEAIITTFEETGVAPPCRAKPEVFFPEDFHEPSQRTFVESWAKKLCGRCPHQMQCLDYALTQREPTGIWGGLTARERNNLLRR